MTQAPPSVPPPKDNFLRYFLIGCLGFFLLSALCVGIGGWYVATHIKQVATGIGRQVAVNVINQSNLPDDQKKGITAHVDRVMEDYKAGKITDDQMGKIMEEIAKSPVLVVGVVYAVNDKYVKNSGLGLNEKSVAERTLQRLGRGAYEKKISEAAFKRIMKPVMKTGLNGQEQLKDSLTDEELRQFIALAKTEADKSGVPDENYTIDITAEIGKAIDRALHPPAVIPTTTTSPAEDEAEVEVNQ